MNKVTMKALDTMHMSNVQADNLHAGDKFDVSEADAKILEDRGLAARLGAAKEDKAEAPRATKAISADSVKAAPARKAGK